MFIMRKGFDLIRTVDNWQVSGGSSCEMVV